MVNDETIAYDLYMIQNKYYMETLSHSVLKYGAWSSIYEVNTLKNFGNHILLKIFSYKKFTILYV